MTSEEIHVKLAKYPAFLINRAARCLVRLSNGYQLVMREEISDEISENYYSR